MKYEIACADANILGHLYRSGTSCLIRQFFQQVLIDSWILDEIKRRQPEILPDIEEELASGPLFVLVDRAELIRRKVLSIYEAELDDMHYLFMPQDEGEKRVIALARATGTGFVLTDDEKKMAHIGLLNEGLLLV